MKGQRVANSAQKQRTSSVPPRDRLDRANAGHYIHKEDNMHNKIDRRSLEFNREVLTELQNAIQHTKEAIKYLESAWGGLVIDAAFKNMAPDDNYVEDLMYALSDIQLLQYTLEGNQPGPLSNFNEVLRRWRHDRIAEPMRQATAAELSVGVGRGRGLAKGSPARRQSKSTDLSR
jgi:hypothetical protein